MDRIRRKRPNIAVIGDLMIDHYILGSCERISPEAPVPVVNVSKESAVLGGAGNVVNNLISLGADVSIFSVVGNDTNTKELGDILILGLNSDESITRLKGKERPINNLEDRAFLIGALESIDFVVPFKEDTPYELIKLVKPNILVKGADYEGKEVVGSDIADDVKLISFVEGKSTTNLIAKINKGELC